MHITARQILESTPSRFRPEKAHDYSAVFHFIISGDENFELSVIIDQNTCTVSDTATLSPACTISCRARTYIELETGRLNPQLAFTSGKITVSNIAEMIQFAKCFRKFDAQSVNENNTLTSANPTATVRQKRTGPLEGVTIIDFTRLLPGPMATMMLADMGADVIKVEDPDSPDYVRHFEPLIGHTSAYYYALNRNKRSLAINFLSEKGKAILIELIKNADVLIEQYRPGVMKKFGFDYEALQSINPRLIYVSITGYGQDSSLSQAAGHDLNYIAIAGALGITGDEIGKPVVPGFQLADIAGGSYMTMNAVTAALYKREKTNTGEWLDLAMTDSVLPFIALPFAEYQAKGASHRRGQFQLSGGQANYNIYQCSDGKYVALGALEPKFWNAVCVRLNKPEWQAMITGGTKIQDRIKQELQEIFLQKPREEWLEFFATDDICLTRVNELEEIAADKYLNERKLFVDFRLNDTEIKTIAHPVKFASTDAVNNWLAPKLGEDSYTILKEMGKTHEAIQVLIKENIILTA